MSTARSCAWIAFLAALTAAGPARGQEKPAPERAVDFYGEIKPILSIHCAKCHDAHERKGGLRLDRREFALRGGDSGDPAIVPGRSAGSALLQRVASTDRDERMPQKAEPLSSREIELLRAWIDQGAPWPERDDYWAFKPPRRPAVPAVRNAAWVVQPIDAFVLARLEERGLSPARPASPEVLLRRVYLDLVGVPPAPEEAERFLNDRSNSAYAALVDRLLADPRYGERWARHWLDLVRYAESDGYENDKIRPQAWRYRDYVIRSLNGDKPYDRFLLEQIAGDELFPGDPDAWVATGFARLSAWDEICKNEKARWQDYLNDIVDTTGSVFLGFTLGCARCHDHKYDRITQADYYSMQAFFVATRRERQELPGGGAGDPPEVRAAFADAERRLRALRREKEELREKHALRVVLEKASKGEPDENLTASEEEIKKSAEKADKGRWGEIDQEIKKHEARADLHRPAAEAVFESGAKAPRTHVLRRGELSHPAEEVGPAVPAALAPARPIEIRAGGTTGRRSALARWLASSENPMTARVLVNRVWQQHFGQGIVPTASDFGRNGERPSHPELLDWLAVEFMAQKWRLKPLHRMILLSSAYRQSADPNPQAERADPENRLLWRMNRRRLEGEAIRDAVLAASGRLNPKRGGPGVYARISKEVLVELPNNDKLPSWGTSTEEEGLRRSIYIFQRRALMYPLLEAFDGADMNHTCPKRASTTVAPQALALFNGEFAREEARHFADRLLREAPGDRARQVERAYRHALARRPSEAETKLALAFLDDQARRRTTLSGTGAGVPDETALRGALQDFCHVLFNTNEFVYVD